MGTVVLFNHPGAEHVPKGYGTTYSWNVEAEHRRKYLSVQAHLAQLEGSAFRRAPTSIQVALWAEFEPQTSARRFAGHAGAWLPESWHTLLPIQPPPPNAQNTDPWIFGEAFRYAYCKQPTLSYLRHLGAGDLLLFGSYKRRNARGEPSPTYNFFLDTVFVVGRGFPLRHTEGIPATLFDLPYRRAAYDLFDHEDREECTFYAGRMLGEKPSEEPFCYSPCVPCPESTPPRKRRPMINDLFNWETGNPQVFTTLGGVTTEQAWQRVTTRCLESGYELAVKVENAPIQPGSEGKSNPLAPISNLTKGGTGGGGGRSRC